MKITTVGSERGTREPKVNSFYRLAVRQIPQTAHEVEDPVTEYYSTADISVGEVCVTSRRKLDARHLLQIEVVRRSTGQSIVLHGIVRWIERSNDAAGYHIGIELFETLDEDRLNWVQLVECHNATHDRWRAVKNF